MQVVVEAVATAKVTLHRRGIVDLQHQLCRQRRAFCDHEAHAAILAVAVNPAVGDGHHAVVIVVLFGLRPDGVVCAQVAAVDVHHHLREGLPIFLVFHFVRLAYGNGFVDLCDGDGDFAAIVDLGLDVAVIIGVGRGALAFRLRARLSADGARQFGDVLAVVIVLEDLPPHLGHRGVVEVGFRAVKDKHALSEGFHLFHIDTATGQDVVLSPHPQFLLCRRQRGDPVLHYGL